jgi:DNA gyrase/topoisomerase IV subunit A
MNDKEKLERFSKLDPRGNRYQMREENQRYTLICTDKNNKVTVIRSNIGYLQMQSEVRQLERYITWLVEHHRTAMDLLEKINALEPLGFWAINFDEYKRVVQHHNHSGKIIESFAARADLTETKLKALLHRLRREDRASIKLLEQENGILQEKLNHIEKMIKKGATQTEILEFLSANSKGHHA